MLGYTESGDGVMREDAAEADGISSAVAIEVNPFILCSSGACGRDKDGFMEIAEGGAEGRIEDVGLTGITRDGIVENVVDVEARTLEDAFDGRRPGRVRSALGGGCCEDGVVGRTREGVVARSEVGGRVR